MGFFNRSSELVVFARGTQTWLYTSDDRPVIYNGQTYLPIAMKRGAISESADLTRNTLDINVPDSIALLDLFRGTTPLDVISMTLYQLPKGSNAATTRWVGVLGSVTFATGGIATVHGLPPMASLQGNGLKRCWQKSCPHNLYGTEVGGCNANKANFRVDATLTSVTASVVQAAVFATKRDGWFDGGWIEWTVGTATERRFIITHVGDTVTLMTPAYASVGTVVASYPGCAHDLTTCDTKFGNSDNYGGQPWIPSTNPFGNNSVF